MSQTEQQKPANEPVFIPAELYDKLEEHAEQKKITVDQEAKEMLELGVKFYEAVFAVKFLSEKGVVEL